MNEIIEFNITDAAISELSHECLGLTILGLQDKKGYETVNLARKTVKGYRVQIEKRRKELTQETVDYKRRVDGEAKRIILMLEPIENYLIEQETEYQNALLVDKKEKEEAQARF